MDRRPGTGRVRDGGQLLLLAGFILVMMFIVTTVTVSELSSLQADVARQQKAPIVDEYEFVRSRVNSTMQSLVTTSTTNSSFNDTFESMVESFTSVQNSKGYDLVVELGGATTTAPKTEDPHFLEDVDGDPAMEYANVSFDGTRNFEGNDNESDEVNDGIIWYQAPSDSSGHIQGYVAYIYVAERSSKMEGTVLFPVNMDG